jgi:hypothetical protein
VAEDLFALVVAAVDDLVTALMQPGGASGAQLEDLLTKLEKLLLQLVALAKDAVDDFFTLLNAVIEAIQALLDATIDIPLVSWLYQKLTGDELSLMDLFSLILAVPVTVMCKAITGQAPYQTQTAAIAESGQPALPAAALAVRPEVPALPTTTVASGESLNIVNMIVTFNGLAYAFTDVFSNAMAEENPPLIPFLQGISGLISLGLSVPINLPSQQERDYLLRLLYGGFAPIWNFHSADQARVGNSTSNNVLPTWGIGAAIWDGVYAGMYPADYFEPDGLKLAQNELGNLSTISGYAKNSDDPEVLAVLLIVDFFLDMANALIEIKWWWS